MFRIVFYTTFGLNNAATRRSMYEVATCIPYQQNTMLRHYVAQILEKNVHVQGCVQLPRWASSRINPSMPSICHPSDPGSQK